MKHNHSLPAVLALLLASAIAVPIAVPVAASAQETDVTVVSTEDGMATEDSRAIGVRNQIAVRDAQTGRLRAPTTAEAVALSRARAKPIQSGKASVGAARRTNSALVHVSGAKGMRFTDAQMSYAVIHRHPDGTLSTHCVHGKVAAEAAALNLSQE